MDTSTGNLYPSVQAAIAAGARPENVVELSEEAVANLRRQLLHLDAHHPVLPPPRNPFEAELVARAELKRQARAQERADSQ